jgi:hypothetical protein
MSNNNSTELLAWAREVCAIHTELARPIEIVSDPRLRALRESWPNIHGDGWAPEALGEFYFTKIGVKQLPACPLPAPPWGVERDTRVGEWPDVAIIDRGAEWASGQTKAHLERETTILVDALPRTDQTDTRLPGDVDESTSIVVGSDVPEGQGGAPTFYVSLEHAGELGCVIGDALKSARGDTATPRSNHPQDVWEKCKTVPWCAGHWTLGDPNFHAGEVGTVTVNDSTVNITVDGPCQSGGLEFHLEMDGWDVPADEIDNEMQDMGGVASEAREVMRAWRLVHAPEIL